MSFQENSSKVVLRMTYPISHEKNFVDTNGTPLDEHEFSPGSDDTTCERSPRDCDLNLQLGLRPGLRVDLFPKESSALVSSWGRVLTFTGKLYVDLFQLLATGNLSAGQIEDKFRDTHESVQVRTALYRLSSKAILVTTSHKLSQNQALFWSHLGITPALAEEYLNELPIYLSSLTTRPFPPQLREQMYRQGGWQFVNSREDAALVIYWTDSFANPDIADINKQHLADGKKWLLMQVTGSISLFGPIFCPAPEEGRNNRPCWECLHLRFTEGANNVQTFLAKSDEAQTVEGTGNLVSSDEELPLAHLRAELSSWLVAKEKSKAALSSHLIFSTSPHEKQEYHWVKQRPQCSVCGDKSLLSPEREPQPPVFKPQTVAAFTSGGLRKKTPS